MATINTTAVKQNVPRSIGSGRGLAVTTLDLIGAFADGPGTQTGEDALSVLNRKLEASGVLTTGTSPPTFNATSPLLFYNTDDDTLHVKGASAYEDLADNSGFADNVIIGVGTTTPTYNAAHTSAAPLVFYNTTTAELWLKATGRYVQVTLTAGDIGYTPPSGSNILRSSVDTVEDAINDLEAYLRNLPSSGGGGTDDQTASEVNTDTSNFNNNLSNADTTVQRALDTLDNVTLGGGTDDQTASEVPTTTTNFTENLSSSDSNVQRALDTIDDLDIPPYYQTGEEHSDNDLRAVNDRYQRSFTIPQKLRDYRDNFDQNLYIIVDFEVEVQQSTIAGQSITFRCEVLEGDGTSIDSPNRISAESRPLNDNLVNSDVQKIRIRGVLPRDFDNGFVDAVVIAATNGQPGNAPPDGGVNYYDIKVFADASLIDPTNFDGNLTESDDDVQKVAQKFNDYVPTASQVTVASTGFNGQLVSTDNTVQKVAQKVDDLVIPTVPAPQNASQVAIANPTNSNTFNSPTNFIGGLRGIGVSGYENDPDDVRAALRVTDYRLQKAYSPFQETQLLDRSSGGGFTSTFTLNDSNPTLRSNDIVIPPELRNLGTNIAVRVHVRFASKTGAFTGNISLVDDSSGFPDITGTTPHTIISTVSAGSNEYIAFQDVILAAHVQSDGVFQVEFNRTSGSGTGAEFQEGFVSVIDSPAMAMGGAGGQSADFSETIIWLAGAGINDRLITSSETINRTLIAGHNFDDYDILQFVFDAGPGGNQPLIPTFVTSNLFLGGGANGILWIVGQYWLMVSRHGPNIFRWRWRSGVNGLRRIIGIRTA